MKMGELAEILTLISTNVPATQTSHSPPPLRAAPLQLPPAPPAPPPHSLRLPWDQERLIIKGRNGKETRRKIKTKQKAIPKKVPQKRKICERG